MNGLTTEIEIEGYEFEVTSNGEHTMIARVTERTRTVMQPALTSRGWHDLANRIEITADTARRAFAALDKGNAPEPEPCGATREVRHVVGAGYIAETMECSLPAGHEDDHRTADSWQWRDVPGDQPGLTGGDGGSGGTGPAADDVLDDEIATDPDTCGEFTGTVDGGMNCTRRRGHTGPHAFAPSYVYSAEAEALVDYHGKNASNTRIEIVLALVAGSAMIIAAAAFFDWMNR